eukprot:jgi/Bigna1/79380/fgenesh1_pg.62_\
MASVGRSEKKLRETTPVIILFPSWVSHSRNPARDSSPIYSVDVHPDGTRFATGGSGSVKIWSTSELDRECEYEKRKNFNQNCASSECKERLLAILKNHMGSVNCVKWSKDGTYLASGSDDKSVMIWRLENNSNEGFLGSSSSFFGGQDVCIENWACKAVLKTGSSTEVLDLAWDPRSRRVASCHVDNTVVIWSTKQGTPLRVLRGHTGWVTGVTWDPKDRFLATQALDGSVILWNIEDGKSVKRITKPFEAKQFGRVSSEKDLIFQVTYTRLSWSSDGKYLAACRGYYGERKDCISECEFNPVYALAIGGMDKKVTIWTSTRNKAIISLDRAFKKTVLDLAWTPSGNGILVCSYDGTLAYIRGSTFNFLNEFIAILRLNLKEHLHVEHERKGETLVVRGGCQRGLNQEFIVETPEILELRRREEQPVAAMESATVENFPPSSSFEGDKEEVANSKERKRNGSSKEKDHHRRRRHVTQTLSVESKQEEVYTSSGKRRIVPVMSSSRSSSGAVDTNNSSSLTYSASSSLAAPLPANTGGSGGDNNSVPPYRRSGERSSSLPQSSSSPRSPSPSERRRKRKDGGNRRIRPTMEIEDIMTTKMMMGNGRRTKRTRSDNYGEGGGGGVGGGGRSSISEVAGDDGADSSNVEPSSSSQPQQQQQSPCSNNSYGWLHPDRIPAVVRCCITLNNTSSFNDNKSGSNELDSRRHHLLRRELKHHGQNGSDENDYDDDGDGDATTGATNYQVYSAKSSDSSSRGSSCEWLLIMAARLNSTRRRSTSEDGNEADGDDDNHNKRQRVIIWKRTMPARVLAVAANQHAVVAATQDNLLHIFTVSGRRLSLPMIISGAIFQLQLSKENVALVATCDEAIRMYEIYPDMIGGGGVKLMMRCSMSSLRRRHPELGPTDIWIIGGGGGEEGTGQTGRRRRRTKRTRGEQPAINTDMMLGGGLGIPAVSFPNFSKYIYDRDSDSWLLMASPSSPLLSLSSSSSSSLSSSSHWASEFLSLLDQDINNRRQVVGSSSLSSAATAAGKLNLLNAPFSVTLNHTMEHLEQKLLEAAIIKRDKDYFLSALVAYVKQLALQAVPPCHHTLSATQTAAAAAAAAQGNNNNNNNNNNNKSLPASLPSSSRQNAEFKRLDELVQQLLGPPDWTPDQEREEEEEEKVSNYYCWNPSIVLGGFVGQGTAGRRANMLHRAAAVDDDDDDDDGGGGGAEKVTAAKSGKKKRLSYSDRPVILSKRDVLKRLLPHLAAAPKLQTYTVLIQTKLAAASSLCS